MGFFSGVYSSCIGFTMELKNRKTLIGLSGIIIGLGEVLGNFWSTMEYFNDLHRIFFKEVHSLEYLVRKL